MDTRRATQRDLERIRALHAESGLAALPSNVPLSNVIVALEGREAVGGIALAVCARSGLLRSAVVAPSYRRQGVGTSLVQSLLARAHELGLRDLYLLTDSASEFFATVGFVTLDRSELPREIRATPEYKRQQPESSIAMMLPLATRW
jgi:amino-acid N-acetyltransferase